MALALLVYGVGILIGLAVMRDPLVPRLVTAALWPLGPATGVVVVCGLLIVAAILWPVHVGVAAAAIGTVIYLIA